MTLPLGVHRGSLRRGAWLDGDLQPVEPELGFAALRAVPAGLLEVAPASGEAPRPACATAPVAARPADDLAARLARVERHLAALAERDAGVAP